MRLLERRTPTQRTVERRRAQSGCASDAALLSAAPVPPRAGIKRRLRSVVWLVFGLGLLGRLAYIAWGPWDLAADEAYYWQWSRRPDVCYYSKGPLVAYLIWAGTHLAGHTPLGVRWPAVLLSGAAFVAGAALLRRLAPDDDRALAGLLLASLTVPLLVAGSLLTTIDAPLCAAWAVAMWLLHRAVRGPRPSLARSPAAAAIQRNRGAWTGLGLVFGLGLMAKYTMLFWVPTVFVYLALCPDNRRWLRRPEPYLALIGGLLFLLPQVLWNIQHDWVTLQHTLAKSGAGEPTAWLANLINLPELAASQAGLASPLWFALLCVGVWANVRLVWASLRTHGTSNGETPTPTALALDRACLIVSAVAPVTLFYGLLSFKKSINGNWLAIAYLPAVMAAACHYSAKWAAGERRRRLIAACGIGGAMVAVLLGSDRLYRLGGSAVRKVDLTARLKGWRQLGAAAGEELKAIQQAGPAFLLGHTYQLASELAFYTPGQPWSYCVPADPPRNQYDVWGGWSELRGRNAVLATVIQPGSAPRQPAPVRAAFGRVEAGPTVVVERHGVAIARFQLWRCYDFRGWSRDREQPAQSGFGRVRNERTAIR